MSYAFKCDRCGSYSDKKPAIKAINGSYVIGVRAYTNNSLEKKYELCEDCILKFYEFINDDI